MNNGCIASALGLGLVLTAGIAYAQAPPPAQSSGSGCATRVCGRVAARHLAALGSGRQGQRRDAHGVA